MLVSLRDRSTGDALSGIFYNRKAPNPINLYFSKTHVGMYGRAESDVGSHKIEILFELIGLLVNVQAHLQNLKRKGVKQKYRRHWST